MNQICSAVRYLHSKNVCHRDLKFENIMFESKDDNAMVILIDFGLSKAYKPGQVMSETVRVKSEYKMFAKRVICIMPDRERLRWVRGMRSQLSLQKMEGTMIHLTFLCSSPRQS